MANQNPQSEKQPQPEKPREQTRKAGDNKKWDIIDEQSWESFPGSDAPAAWAGKDIAPQDREKIENENEDDNENEKERSETD
jgi:hypothetical protein